MHRFYLPPDQCHEPLLRLTGREAHHASHVLRLQPGESVTVLDGAGHEFHCEVKATNRDAVQLAVVQKTFVPPLPCQITLLQAVPKGKIIEDIIEKATELGVHRIVPLLTARVTTRLNAEEAALKAEKWRVVAIEAIKQCGAAWLPQVDAPVTAADFFARKEIPDLALVGALLGERQHPRQYLREFQTKHGRPARTVSIWIGPEGDFTPDELKRILNDGAKPISLGRLVLRVETAAICCLSFLNYELQTGGSAD